MKVRLGTWLMGDCPAAASPRGWCLFQLGLLLLPSSVLLASLLFVPVSYTHLTLPTICSV